jgi:putative ATP-dependent endonuclease of the OLD family
MRIAELEIDNFRGIKKGHISFGEHSVFIGSNNTGKTTIIEALALLFGRERLVKTLTEYDFYGGNPQAEDRLKLLATVIDFDPNEPDVHIDWFRPGRAVPKWYDPKTKLVHPEKTEDDFRLCAQIGFIAW